MALGSTQPLTEMSTRNLLVGGGGKGLPARKADNLAAICEIIWEPRRLTNLWTSMAPCFQCLQEDKFAMLPYMYWLQYDA
jgi:hypothetical protein